MADGVFTSQAPTRARITNKRTAEFLSFGLNPSSIDLEGGSSYVEDPIPGQYPLRRWMSAKSKKVSFKIDLDGQMSVRRFGTVVSNSINPTTTQVYSVQGEVDWYWAFNAPTDPLNDPGGDGSVDLVVFNYGSTFKNWECDIEIPKIELQEFSLDLVPIKAVVHVVLHKKIYASETYGQVWGGS